MILIIVWASYTLFTMISGARGVIVNDTIMYVLFTIAAIIGMGIAIGAAGGPIAAVERMTTFAEKPDGMAWFTIAVCAAAIIVLIAFWAIPHSGFAM